MRYAVEPSETRDWKWQVACEGPNGESTRFGASSLSDAVDTPSDIVKHDLAVDGVPDTKDKGARP